MKALQAYAAQYAAGEPVTLDVELLGWVPRNQEELALYEAAHQVRWCVWGGGECIFMLVYNMGIVYTTWE